MSILANLSADKAGLEAFVSSGAAAELLATALHILQHETPTVPVQQAPCGEPTRAVTPMGDVPHASNDVAGTGQVSSLYLCCHLNRYAIVLHCILHAVCVVWLLLDACMACLILSYAPELHVKGRKMCCIACFMRSVWFCFRAMV